MADSPLPTDLFSQTRRRLVDNPGACRSGSTIHTADFYGNIETWVVETFRVDGSDVVLLQRIGEGAVRLVIPDEVTAALARHVEANAKAIKRKQGHALIARRRERGDTLGNPEALARARRAKKGGR